MIIELEKIGIVYEDNSDIEIPEEDYWDIDDWYSRKIAVMEANWIEVNYPDADDDDSFDYDYAKCQFWHNIYKENKFPTIEQYIVETFTEKNMQEWARQILRAR